MFSVVFVDGDVECVPISHSVRSTGQVFEKGRPIINIVPMYVVNIGRHVLLLRINTAKVNLFY